MPTPTLGLYSWGDGNIGLVANGLGVIQVYGTQCDIYNVSTRDGYRFTSNGGYNGWYYNGSYLAQKSGAGDLAHLGLHPRRCRLQLGRVTPNAPQAGLWTLDSGGYAGATAAAWDLASSRRFKEGDRFVAAQVGSARRR